MHGSMWGVIAALASSIAACILIVHSSPWHLWFSGDKPGTQPQKFHAVPVPRIGGFGVLLGMLAAGFLLPLTPAEATVYWWLLLALLPAFLGGVLEDTLFRLGALMRLLLTLLTGALAFGLAGVQFVRSDVVWLNHVIAFLPAGYCMLLFAVAGVAHSMNIIDGHHGLAGGVGLVVLVAMGHVAQQSGDVLVAQFCYVTASATFGFLLVNYPAGRVFLGDGGAYLLGCVIALAAAMLVQRNPEVSPWFPMALVVYPVWETLFSVARRALIYRTRIGEADALHLHSLLHRWLARRWVSGQTPQARNRRNALTTLPFWGVSVVVAILAVQWSQSTPLLMRLVLAFIGAYTLVYWQLARLATPAPQMAESLNRPRQQPQPGVEAK